MLIFCKERGFGNVYPVQKVQTRCESRRGAMIITEKESILGNVGAVQKFKTGLNRSVV